jgi:ribosomal protein S18 acetylase RimI-like enzyme
MSALVVLRASPDDSRIDDFYFGDEPWATEVEQEFKSRIWERNRDLFLFCFAGEVVAGARLSYRPLGEPHRDSSERARYFLIVSFGVNVPFQRQPDPGSPNRTFASTILNYAEAKGRERPDCVGLSLFVREGNARARRLYERHGFEYEPGAFEREGLPTLEMRKRFGTAERS